VTRIIGGGFLGKAWRVASWQATAPFSYAVLGSRLAPAARRGAAGSAQRISDAFELTLVRQISGSTKPFPQWHRVYKYSVFSHVCAVKRRKSKIRFVLRYVTISSCVHDELGNQSGVNGVKIAV